MGTLNFHHLLLFTTLVREGSLVAAGRVLRLSHSTVSAQIRAFEDSLGVRLVQRQGRRLVPTDEGRVAFRYGEEIFGLGRELVQSVVGRSAPTSRLRVGIADVLPKLMVRRLLRPLFAAEPPIHLVCLEDSHDPLLVRLAMHEIDVVLSDAPAESRSSVRAYNHLLGTCGATVFGAAKFEPMQSNFPRSLDGAPMLLPLDGSTLRRALNVWFAANDVRPRVVSEFEDSALLKVIAQDGVGVFAGPTAIEREIETQYGVRALGRLPDVREQFYAISLERRIRDPAIATIFSAARHDVFAPPKRRGARSS